MFSIVKLAHLDYLLMALIHHQYELIKWLSKLALPVPAILKGSIHKNSKTYGFQIAELHNISHEELRNLLADDKEVFTDIYQARHSHRDLSPVIL